MNKKKRFGIGFVGSGVFHLLAAVLLALLGLLVVPQPKDNVIEIEMVEIAGGSSGGGGAPIVVPHQSPPVPKMEKDAITEKKQNAPEQPQQPAPNQDSNVNQDTPQQGQGEGGSGTSEGTGTGDNTGGSGTGTGTGDGDGSGDYDNSAAASGSGKGHYDQAAVRQGYQGSVTIRGLLGPDGRIQDATVVTSSGNSTIDNMGIRDMMAGSYTPARNKEGQPIAAYVRRTFTYKLR